MSRLRHAAWRRLSREPQVFFCKDFLTPAECDVFVNIATECNRLEVRPRVLLKTDTPHLRPDEVALLQEVEDRVSALSGAPIHEGETPWAVKHKLGVAPPPDDASGWGFFRGLFERPPRRTPIRRVFKGLHLDTNYTPRRWLTFIAYLRTTPPQAGGHTVFPLAGSAGQHLGPEHRQLRAHAELLLGCGIDHTHFASRCEDPAIRDRVGAAARALMAHAELVAAGAVAEASACAADAVGASGPLPYAHPGGLGLAVPAIQGSCVAFFTRSLDAGAIDPLAFHGGTVVTQDGVPKWTLQRFREMPEDVPMEELSEFVMRQKAMKDCVGGGVRFSVEG